jgi:general secretion pathway protein G
MADEKPTQGDEHITAKKPAPSAEPKGNSLQLPDDDISLKPRRRWAIRVLLALVTGAIVSSTAYLCAFYQYRDYYYFRFEQRQTRETLKRLQADVDRHQKDTGRLPEKLTDLESVQTGELRVDDAGQPVDGWRRPIQYRIEADGYSLFSYGRDGQPGGQGLDADLYAGTVDKENERPTLWQFATILDNGGWILKGCVLAGAFALALCLIGGEGWRGKRSLAVVLFAHALTALCAILTAVVISVLHLPSGH